MARKYDNVLVRSFWPDLPESLGDLITQAKDYLMPMSIMIRMTSGQQPGGVRRLGTSWAAEGGDRKRRPDQGGAIRAPQSVTDGTGQASVCAFVSLPNATEDSPNVSRSSVATWRSARRSRLRARSR